MVSSYLFFLLLFGTTEALFTFDLSQITVPYTVKAVTYCGQKLWYPYKEGLSFFGTNRECQRQAFLNRTAGYSFMTTARDALPYINASWYGVRGECRLFYPSKDFMYIYSEGPKWAILIDHLNEGDQPYCPMNQSSYIGVQRKDIRSGLIKYIHSMESGISQFCVRMGHLSAGCYGVPIQINAFGRQIEFVNSTTLDAETKYCSLVRGGCGASEALYERYDPTTTRPVDKTWTLKCYVWPSKNC